MLAVVLSTWVLGLAWAQDDAPRYEFPDVVPVQGVIVPPPAPWPVPPMGELPRKARPLAKDLLRWRADPEDDGKLIRMAGHHLCDHCPDQELRTASVYLHSAFARDAGVPLEEIAAFLRTTEEDPWCRAALGDVHLLQGDFAAARDDYLQVEGGPEARVAYHLAWSRLMVGEAELAWEDLARAHALGHERALADAPLFLAELEQPEGAPARFCGEDRRCLEALD